MGMINLQSSSSKSRRLICKMCEKCQKPRREGNLTRIVGRDLMNQNIRVPTFLRALKPCLCISVSAVP